MSLVDRIKAEGEKSFVNHPVGTFDAVVEEIVEREWEGVPIYELMIRSQKGVAKVGIWKTVHADIDGRLSAGGGSHDEAEQKYVKALGRVIRLYRDLGLPAPHGETETAIEEQVYGRMPEMVGKACKLVVQPDRRDQNRVVCFINSAKKAEKGNGASVSSAPPVAASGQAPAAMSLDEIPF